MKNKILASGGGVLLLMSFAVAGIALAAEMTGGAAMHTDSMKPSSMMMMHPPAAMIVTINNDGTGRLRGVVASVSTNSITVATWGGVWTIHADTNATILRANSSLSDIKVGDYVGASGKVSEDSPTLTATVIRDWTAKTAMMHDTMMKDNHMMASTTSR